jgi:basic membrane protein A and related proteins
MNLNGGTKRMKKIIGILILVLALSLLFIYCGDNNDTDDEQQQDSKPEEVSQDNENQEETNITRERRTETTDTEETTEETMTEEETTEETMTEEETTEETMTEEETTDSDSLKLAMSTDIGGVNDESFNASAWAGLKKARDELGVEVKFLESKSDADYDRNLKNLADQDYDLIWGIGFLMAEAVRKAANDYPNHKFGIIDSNMNNNVPPNAVAVTFKEEEGAFLVGVIAGMMTEENKIGFIGGERFPLIRKFMYGYKAGVLTVNEDAEIKDVWADSFVDASKGKTLANQLYGDGVDVIFHAAGNVGKGLFEAAKDHDKWAIGVDSDQSKLAPENILTSMMKRVDNAIYDVAVKLQAGEFPGGEVVSYGLEEDGVGYAPTHDAVTDKIIEEVERYKNLIINGSIEVPYDEETFEDFKANL